MAGDSLDALFTAPQIHTDENGRHWDSDGGEYRMVDVDGKPLPRYVLRATYRGERVDVVQALQGANWAILLDGVTVTVSVQSLSDFRSERVEPNQDDEETFAPTTTIPFHRTADGFTCRFSQCTTTRMDGACPVCRDDAAVTLVTAAIADQQAAAVTR